MIRAPRIRSAWHLLLAIGLIGSAGCDSATSKPGTASPPKPVASKDAQAWNLGNKLSLAAIGHAEQAPPGAIDRVLQEAQGIARELGAPLEPLPTRTGNRSRDAAAALGYLLKTTGPAITRALEEQHGRQPSLLFQISLKTNLLLLVYEPSSNNREASAIIEFVSEKGAEANLPGDLMRVLASDVRSGASYDQVKQSVQQFQQHVAAHLAGSSGHGAAAPSAAVASAPPPATATTPPTANSPPPAPPRRLAAGEQYLRDLRPTAVEALGGSDHAMDRPFDVQRVTFQNGVYIHPPAAKGTGRATYQLGTNHVRLRGAAAISDHRFQKAWSPVTFRVIGDGQVLWTSRPLQTCGEWEAFDINIAGVNQLTLEVSCDGDHTGAHGSWINPILVQSAP